MRNLQYFWIKRINILFGLIATIPFPAFTYLWLSGEIATRDNIEMLSAWTNPGILSTPIALSVIFFLGGSIALLYVFLRCDIDSVLPQEPCLMIGAVFYNPNLDIDWEHLKVGDVLVSTTDVYLKSHRVWYKWYPHHRQFTARKEYKIYKVRRKTSVIFIIDDGGFYAPLNRHDGRKFHLK